MACEAAVQADPGWQEAMRKRGVEDFSLAMVDPWAAGYTGPERRPVASAASCRAADLGALRAGRARLRAPGRGAHRASSTSTRMEVVEVDDHGVVPLPPKAGNYDLERMVARGQRPALHRVRAGDLKPIEITQPEGPSFTVDGHHVALAEWDLRLGFTPREGLVLHEIGYEDSGTLRPIIHRALAGRDVRALRRPGADAPVQERLRPGRVRRSAGWPTR